jgi:hypothetical protein
MVHLIDWHAAVSANRTANVEMRLVATAVTSFDLPLTRWLRGVRFGVKTMVPPGIFLKKKCRRAFVEMFSPA